MRRVAVGIAIALILIVGVAGIYLVSVSSGGKTTSGSGVSTTSSSTSTSGGCGSAGPVKDKQLSNTTFGAVTEFTLPTPYTSPNAITVAPDGSVWFGENGMPGLGHLFPNGTLTEYKLPFESSLPQNVCGDRAQIWGVALWDGGVWATNENQPVLEGIDPATGVVTNVTLRSGTQPYTVNVGPEGDLWITQLAGGPDLARVAPVTHQVQYLSLPGNDSWSTQYVVFANNTLGYALEIDAALANSPTAVSSVLYSFNPQSSDPVFTQAAPNATLYSPTSIALGEGGIWLTEHSGTGMAFFNTTSSKWTIFPTSTVPYVPETLTYFDGSNGTAVWFDEHFANQMGVISQDGRRLIEYSFSDPPVSSLQAITNTESMALAAGRTWFTQWTGNVVGFVNQSYPVPFVVSSQNSTIQLRAGSSEKIQVRLSGQSDSNLSFLFSDNEVFNGTAEGITFLPSTATFPSLDGTQTVSLTVSAANSIAPGNYTAAITVSDGLVRSSVFVTIVVTGQP